MRKLLLAGLMVATFSAQAQKVDDVQEKISKGKYDEAKEKVDKMLEDPKGQKNAQAWYLKGKVYTELVRQDSMGTLTYDAGKEAFDALKKYQEMDAKNIYMVLHENVELFQLYDLYYNRGISQYNKKNYDESFEKLKFANSLKDYIYQKGFSYNGFTFSALDTQLVNLTASAAYMAKKEADAMPYWEKIADAKVNQKEFREVYSTLADYYMRTGNKEKADKYLALGSQLYPDEEFWTAIEFGEPGKAFKEELDRKRDELNNATTDADKKRLQAEINALDEKYHQEKFARYQQMVQKYPNSYALNMDYAIDYFNYTYGNDSKPADYTARQERTGTLLAKAVTVNANSALANYVMSQHIYNQIYDLEEALRSVRGTAAADVAKRKDINNKLNAKYEEIYPYILKAYDLYSAQTDLKGSDKVNLRKSIDILIDYHDRKKQADKVAMYEAKKKAL